PSSNFVFAASTASYCLTTSRVLLCHDTHANPPYYFLPRGRKDVHEHIQSAAIRETFEEGGYRVRLVRGQHRTLQPRGMGVSHTEPFWTLLQPYPRRHHLPQSMEDIALYIASYYLAEILGPRDSAYGRSFVGKHEGGYDSGLYPIEEAVELLTRGRMFVKDG
ncbi:hypothetical protein FPQ18DRAFT_240219, partial [Pyronema domesticum]